MLKDIAVAAVLAILFAGPAAAQGKRCATVNITFSCVGGGGEQSSRACKPGDSETACCARWRAAATRTWCAPRKRRLGAFGCGCSGLSLGKKGALVRPGTTRSDPDRPLVTGRALNPMASHGGAKEEDVEPAKRRAPKTLKKMKRGESFSPRKKYTGVQMQQGRVATDSDLNTPLARFCPKTRYTVTCKDGTPEGVNIVCQRGEAEGACCKRGRHAAIKDCLRHGGVAEMKCACPRPRMRRVK